MALLALSTGIGQLKFFKSKHFSIVFPLGRLPFFLSSNSFDCRPDIEKFCVSRTSLRYASILGFFQAIPPVARCVGWSKDLRFVYV